MTKKKQHQTSNPKRMGLTVSEALSVFEQAFRTGNPNEVEGRLREMLNVQVAVIDSRQEAEVALASRKRFKTVAVPYRVFLGKVRGILGKRDPDSDEEEPGVYSLEPNSILDDSFSRYMLRSVWSSDVVRPGNTYALLKTLAGYSSEMGLTFSGSENATGFENQPDEDYREKFTEGRFQTWMDHAIGVWERSRRLEKIYRPFVEKWARNALAPQWEKADGETQLTEFVNAVLWAMRVAVLFHDIGKLAKKWQRIVWEIEETIQGKDIKRDKQGQFIARTSLIDDKEIQKHIKRPPPHAPFAYPFLQTFLKRSLGDYRFLDAIALASARHHSLDVAGDVKEGEFNLENDVEMFLGTWLPQILELTDENKVELQDVVRKSIETTQNGSEADEPPSPSDDFYFLYCLTNRMVKLCDWEDAGSRTVELAGFKERKSDAVT